MNPTGRISRPAWMAAPETLRVMAALIETPEDPEARFVGGCVRDALINRTVIDIDIATSLPPEEVIKRLKADDIKVIPTGLKHGTVTAVIDGQPFEITTLRQDVKHYGRHADVEFTDDWLEDAARRDFTMNAIFCAVDGTLYDAFGGVIDLREGHVRFVGDPAQRIEEDVLRILRYFRFLAHFGKGKTEDEALAACVAQADKIPNLSGERIRNEVLKLLTGDHANTVWQVMIDSGIMQYILPEATDCASLTRLMKLETHYRSTMFPLRRLATLLPSDEKIARDTGNALKLSNADKDLLVGMCNPEKAMSWDMKRADIRAYVYRHGNDMARNRLLRKGAKQPDGAGPDLRLDTLYQYATACRLPRFPVRGADVVKLGVPDGPEIGRIMKALENWWVEQDFEPNRRACLDKMAELKDAVSE